jgi:hypothetical protein
MIVTWSQFLATGLGQRRSCLEGSGGERKVRSPAGRLRQIVAKTTISFIMSVSECQVYSEWSTFRDVT